MDHRSNRFGAADDAAGTGIILWRARTCPKCAQGIHALLCNCLFDEHFVVCFWVFHRFWRRRIRVLGWFGQNVPFGRNGGQPVWHTT